MPNNWGAWGVRRRKPHHESPNPKAVSSTQVSDCLASNVIDGVGESLQGTAYINSTFRPKIFPLIAVWIPRYLIWRHFFPVRFLPIVSFDMVTTQVECWPRPLHIDQCVKGAARHPGKYSKRPKVRVIIEASVKWLLSRRGTSAWEMQIFSKQGRETLQGWLDGCLFRILLYPRRSSNCNILRWKTKQAHHSMLEPHETCNTSSF